MPFRVIHDGPLDGPTNMARDEALLEGVGAGESPPTLRLYRWAPPTISLGCFQLYADYAALAPPAGRLPVVRRITGGGAILHDGELTYSIALPARHEITRGNPLRLYEVAHDALIECLRRLDVPAYRGCPSDGSGPTRGPFFCFARRHCLDVLIGHDKLAGSAQRRTRRGILQHGSILWERRYDQQPSAALGPLLNLDMEEFAARWLAALADVTCQTFSPSAWTAAELHLAETLRAKCAGDEWTLRR